MREYLQAGKRAVWRHKKWLGAAGCALAAAVMLYVAGNPPAVGAAATQRQLPIYCVQKDYKVASLSFDAAWGDVRVRQAPGLQRSAHPAW